MKDINEIKKELQEIAPTLAQIPKRTPNNVPDKYFDEVEENLVSQCTILAYEKSLNISVPSQYFENVETDITKGLENIEVKHISNNQNRKLFFLKKWMPAVAAIFVLTFSTWFVFKDNQIENKTATAAITDPDLYLIYVQDHINEYNIDMLIEHDLVEESDVSVVDLKFLDHMDDPSNLIESEIHF